MPLSKDKYEQKWIAYVNSCPTQNLVTIETGSVFFLKCENRTEDGLLLKPKYRPILFVDGKDLAQHPEVTKRLDLPCDKPKDVAPYLKDSLIGIPLTTTHKPNRQIYHKFDLNLDELPINAITYNHANPAIQPGENPKKSYIHPGSLFRFDQEEIEKLFDLEFQDPSPRIVNQKYIGHVDTDQLNQILQGLGDRLVEQNKYLNRNNPDNDKLTQFGHNPTELGFHLTPPNDGLNPFEKPAENEPEF